MAIAVFCFAIMNVLIKYLSNYSTVELVFYRALVTFFISGYFIHKKGISIKGNNTKLLILRGIFGFLGLSLYYLTVQKLPLASAVILQYSSPIFTTLIALVVLKEKVLKVQWFAFSICMAGLLMIKQFGEIDWFYFTLGIFSAVFSGAAYNVIRKLKTTENSSLIVFYFPLVTLPRAIVLLAIKGDMNNPTLLEMFFLLMIGVSTQIAQITMTLAYQKEAAAKVSSVTYTGLGYALFFGFLFFNEKPSPIELAGFGVVLVGILINIFGSKYKTKKMSKF